MVLTDTLQGRSWLSDQQTLNPRGYQNARADAARIQALPGFADKLNVWDQVLNAKRTPEWTQDYFDARDKVDAAKAALDNCNAIVEAGADAALRIGYVDGDVELSGWAKTIGITLGAAVLIVALAIVGIALLPETALAAAVAALIALMAAAAASITIIAGVAVASIEALKDAVGGPAAAALGIGTLALIGLGLFLFMGGGRRG
jgi:hypothetical protein